MKLLITNLILFIFPLTAFALTDIENFINLAKKTSSVYTLNATVDKNNGEELSFETMLDNQKVYLTISSAKLNSSVYTLINAEASFAKNKKKNKSLPAPPVVVLGDLNITVDDNNLCSTSGVSTTPSDTSCTGKNCTLKQMVISKCNDTNCWGEDSGIDRAFSEGISGVFNLVDKIDISKCLTNNNEGVKHKLILSEHSDTKGGNVSLRVSVMNDVLE